MRPVNIRKKIIAGNWKMNKTVSEAKAFMQVLLKELEEYSASDVVVCPPFTALQSVSDLLNQSASQVRLGAQNLFPASHGAYTGEISPWMLREFFCHYVIVGHSERRIHLGETDIFINKKVKAALSASLHPILCIGENFDERQQGLWKEKISTQLQLGLKEVEEQKLADCIIAYEPIWAIGTGKNATPEQAQEVHHFIREEITRLFSFQSAQKVRIQYGGSVTAENAQDLLLCPDVDGLLIGGASLDVRSFCSIILNSKF
ncbi:triose-phosphate isomerase [Candidatus Methylacidiphilum infernorum]|uniref:Triosephosphate isomerase n=1 Tax=Methylacidiphilum infernorum (isolate V4) TaxID=481448 RepID=B3DUT3_METI4|nr:triose-phosphate isomerase [Candidatus Methylacidiphilum infernorum]ACD83086.1 Triosephosphate isomerase [Methylacidiphilum infernorum V4]